MRDFCTLMNAQIQYQYLPNNKCANFSVQKTMAKLITFDNYSACFQLAPTSAIAHSVNTMGRLMPGLCIDTFASNTQLRNDILNFLFVVGVGAGSLLNLERCQHENKSTHFLTEI